MLKFSTVIKKNKNKALKSTVSLEKKSKNESFSCKTYRKLQILSFISSYLIFWDEANCALYIQIAKYWGLAYDWILAITDKIIFSAFFFMTIRIFKKKQQQNCTHNIISDT